MEEIRIFKSSEFGKIRTAGTFDNPMFCLTDVCNALGLSAKGVNQRLSDEVISNYPIKDALKQGTLGGEQDLVIVNVYSKVKNVTLADLVRVTKGGDDGAIAPSKTNSITNRYRV